MRANIYIFLKHHTQNYQNTNIFYALALIKVVHGCVRKVSVSQKFFVTLWVERMDLVTEKKI